MVKLTIFGSFLAILMVIVSSCSPNNGRHLEIAPNQEESGGGGGSGGNGLAWDGQIKAIFFNRCGPCHHAGAPIPDWENYQTVYQFRQKIFDYAVTTHFMPLNNATNMTQAERNILGEWIKAGAPKTSGSPTPSPSPPPSPTPSPTPSPQPGPTVVHACFACHDSDGLAESSPDYIPRLAGEPEQYIENQLNDFKSGKRNDPNGIMNAEAQALSSEDIKTVAKYFSSLPVFTKTVEQNTKPAVLPPTEVATWQAGQTKAAECMTCHVPPGQSPLPGLVVPHLLAQKQGYLAAQLKSFRDKSRKNTIMNTMAASLTDSDIQALTLYLSLPTAVTK